MHAAVHVVAVARTPFGRFCGGLAQLSAVELARRAIDEVVARAAVDPARVDALYGGVGMIGTGILTPVRQALLQSCLPQQIPSLTLDRACCSGMTAIGQGFKDISLGLADIVVCGGFESLSNMPFLWPRQRGMKPGRVDVTDPLMLRAEFLDKAIANYTGEEALRHGIDRQMQDEWALRSHAGYFAAAEEGYFGFERFGLSGKVAMEADESPRRDTDIEKLRRLTPVYGGPTVTAGNAPGLNDGAAFLVLASDAGVREHGLSPLAQVTGYSQVADGPQSGTSVPAAAIGRLLARSSRTAAQLDLIEINEAFAATPLVTTLVLAGGDRAAAERLRARTNLRGGAVAIGHPLGASGARIAMTLINGLRRRGGGTGVAAICGGFGQADALSISVA